MIQEGVGDTGRRGEYTEAGSTVKGWGDTRRGGVIQEGAG